MGVINNDEIKSIKEKAIREIVDSSIKNFATGFEGRYESELDNPKGVINSKKNNIFIAPLGKEFIFYSAFVRSFDSSFGKVLENMANSIAKLTYDVEQSDIESYLLPQQTQHIDYLMAEYDRHNLVPNINDYCNFNCVQPKEVSSYIRKHKTDNHLYNPKTKEHFIIELKSGGNLDNKKAKSEKIELLHEYFLLKNKLVNTDETVKVFFATAYNKDGDGNAWRQERVLQFFSEEELLIGRDYWNLLCNDENGFDIVMEQYLESCKYIQKSLLEIKKLYII